MSRVLKTEYVVPWAFKIDEAKTDRSKCRWCERGIALGHLRAGPESVGRRGNFTVPEWLHVGETKEGRICSADSPHSCFFQWLRSARAGAHGDPVPVAFTDVDLARLSTKAADQAKRVLHSAEQGVATEKPAEDPGDASVPSADVTNASPTSAWGSLARRRTRPDVRRVVPNEKESSESYEFVIVLGESAGIEADVLRDVALSTAYFLRQHGLVINDSDDDREFVRQVVEVLLEEDTACIENCPLTFRIWAVESKRELLTRLRAVSRYLHTSLFFCGHGFEDGTFDLPDVPVSGDEIGAAVQHRKTTLYFNCCFAESIVLSMVAGYDARSLTSRKSEERAVSEWETVVTETTVTRTSTLFNAVRARLRAAVAFNSAVAPDREFMDASAAVASNLAVAPDLEFLDQLRPETLLKAASEEEAQRSVQAKKTTLPPVTWTPPSSATFTRSTVEVREPSVPPREEQEQVDAAADAGQFAAALDLRPAALAVALAQLPELPVPNAPMLRPLGFREIPAAGALSRLLAWDGYSVAGIMEDVRIAWEEWAADCLKDQVEQLQALQRSAKSAWRSGARNGDVESMRKLSDATAPVLTVFNSGQADCYLLTIPSATPGEFEAFQIDAGKNSEAWRAHIDLSQLTALFVTHCDSDHVKGLTDKTLKLNERHRPANCFFWSKTAKQLGVGSMAFRSLNEVDQAIGRMNLPKSEQRYPVRGTVLQFKSANVFVLGPSEADINRFLLEGRTAPADKKNPRRSLFTGKAAETISPPNVAGLVLLFVIPQRDGSMVKILFNGDAYADSAVSGVLAFRKAGGHTDVFGVHGQRIALDVLTIPHHGSTANHTKRTNDPSWLELFEVKRFICSSNGGGAGSYSTMGPEVAIAALNANKRAKLYCTFPATKWKDFETDHPSTEFCKKEITYHAIPLTTETGGRETPLSAVSALSPAPPPTTSSVVNAGERVPDSIQPLVDLTRENFERVTNLKDTLVVVRVNGSSTDDIDLREASARFKASDPVIFATLDGPQHNDLVDKLELVHQPQYIMLLNGKIHLSAPPTTRTLSPDAIEKAVRRVLDEQHKPGSAAAAAEPSAAAEVRLPPPPKAKQNDDCAP